MMNSYFKILSLISILPGIISDCPQGTFEGLNQNQEVCYKLFMSPDSFFNAQSRCNMIGGQLASAKNFYVNTYIAGSLSTILENRYFRFWLGANDIESNWSWTDGAQMNYTNWAKGQPRYYGHCLTMHILKGQWYATECHRKLPYLCEFEL